RSPFWKGRRFRLCSPPGHSGDHRARRIKARPVRPTGVADLLQGRLSRRERNSESGKWSLSAVPTGYPVLLLLTGSVWSDHIKGSLTDRTIRAMRPQRTVSD